MLFRNPMSPERTKSRGELGQKKKSPGGEKSSGRSSEYTYSRHPHTRRLGHTLTSPPPSTSRPITRDACPQQHLRASVCLVRSEGWTTLGNACTLPLESRRGQEKRDET